MADFMRSFIRIHFYYNRNITILKEINKYEEYIYTSQAAELPIL